MDNDNKIENNPNRHQEVLLFLQNELEPLKQKNRNSTYDLEKEYEKTKKNKSPFVILILSACLLIVILMAFVLTKTISRADREVKVNVSEFSDLNLKSLVASVSRSQEQYDAAVKNKIQIEREKAGELNAARDKMDGDLVTITSLNLYDKTDEQHRIEAVYKTYENTVALINSKYEVLLEKADKEIERCKENLESYNSEDLAGVQEDSMDSEQLLQDLERRQLTQQYESRISALEQSLADNRRMHNEEMKKSLKTVSDKLQAEIDSLDPKLNDSKAKEILEAPYLNNRMIFSMSNHPAFNKNNINNEELAVSLEEAKQLYDDFKYLDQKVIDLPHKFDIGNYVETDDRIVDQMAVKLTDSVYGQYQANVALQNKMELMKADYENQLQNLRTQMEQITREAEETKMNLLYESMQGAKVSAIIAGVPESIEEIYVFIRPNAVYLVKETGVDAEIPFAKPIKGKVFRADDGRFRFEPAKDKNGNYITFDISALEMGVQVKLK